MPMLWLLAPGMSRAVALRGDRAEQNGTTSERNVPTPHDTDFIECRR
jgi:hypothetical protein